MLKRLLLVAGLTLGLIAAGAPAEAQQYPPAVTGCTVTDTTVTPGQSITITCSGYLGGVTVTFTFFSQPVDLGSATADASGVESFSATIPSNAAVGAHTITATGASASGTLTNSVAVTVVGAGAGAAGAGATGAGDLPRTGDDTSIPLARVAALLVAAGGIALFFARRRKSTADVSV